MNKKQSRLVFVLVFFLVVAAGASITYRDRLMGLIQEDNIAGTYLGNENISVSSPEPGQVVSFPFTISGNARVFENTVSARIIDPVTRAVLFEGSELAQAPDTGQFGEYAFTIKELAQKPTGSDIEVQVFWYSPKDGSQLDPVIVPLKLQ